MIKKVKKVLTKILQEHFLIINYFKNKNNKIYIKY